jgi:hypothetical protein
LFFHWLKTYQDALLFKTLPTYQVALLFETLPTYRFEQVFPRLFADGPFSPTLSQGKGSMIAALLSIIFDGLL